MVTPARSMPASALTSTIRTSDDGVRVRQRAQHHRLTRAKSTVLTPMPIPMVSADTSVSPGDRASTRAPCRSSRHTCSTATPVRSSATRSRAAATVPEVEPDLAARLVLARPPRRRAVGHEHLDVRRHLVGGLPSQSSRGHDLRSGVARPPWRLLRLQHAQHGGDAANPRFLAGGEAPAAGARQRVVAGAAVVLRGRPRARHQARALQPLQGRIERPQRDRSSPPESWAIRWPMP